MNSPTARTIHTHGPAIEAKHLGRNYQVVDKKAGLFAAMKGLWSRPSRTVQAVRDVSFRIEPGEMVAFLGPNGAGKTTTLKMLAGLIYPSSGTATVLGFLPWERHDAFRRQFSLVMGQKTSFGGIFQPAIVLSYIGKFIRFRGKGTSTLWASWLKCLAWNPSPGSQYANCHWVSA